MTHHPLISHVLSFEANAIQALAQNKTILQTIEEAAILIAQTNVPLIISGVGKSGHIARKIASTFCSMGKPASFLHAAEASHGDLGLINPGAALLILSNSGETSELSDLLAYAQEHTHPIIGLTAEKNSTLGKISTVCIAYGKQTEVCRNGLAPTTSTTVSLSIGDALAVTVSEIHKMEPEDFRRYHPGGKLGARLAKAQDMMKTGEAIPFVSPDTSMTEAVIEMSSKNLGVLLVKDKDKIVGIITDGDMRRHANHLLQKTAIDIASPKPTSIHTSTPNTQAIALMAGKGITCCLVHDDNNTFKGLLHIHDCLKG